MGPLAAAGIAAGISALGTGGQFMATSKLNRKTMNWNNQQALRARDWALQDYAMQNEYNSPKAQMQRLKEAGLNPHLVYGNGADATGANMPTPPQATTGRLENVDVQGGVNSALGAYQDIQSRTLQNNLLKAQTTIAEREAQLKEIQGEAMKLGILDKTFDYQFKQELKPYNLQFKKEQVSSLQQNIMESLTRMSNSTWQNNMSQTRLMSDMDSAQLQRMIMRISANKSKAEIDQIRQNIENMKKTGHWQELQNKIQENLGNLNLSSNDPAVFKLLGGIVDKIDKWVPQTDLDKWLFGERKK